MIDAVDKEQIKLLKKLMRLDFLEDFYLAGGTNLALLYNHRKSIDLDLFITQDLSLANSQFIDYKLTSFFGSNYTNIGVTKVGVFGYIDNVKTDFVNYPYPLLKPLLHIKNARLADTRDIVAMKINAILGRGLQKDFFDIHLLLNQFSIAEMMSFFKEKYQTTNIEHVLRSLIYFNDAEDVNQRNNKVVSLINISWEKVKKDILFKVKKYREQIK